jgi:hypothetical protein
MDQILSLLAYTLVRITLRLTVVSGGARTRQEANTTQPVVRRGQFHAAMGVSFGGGTSYCIFLGALFSALTVHSARAEAAERRAQEVGFMIGEPFTPDPSNRIQEMQRMLAAMLAAIRDNIR